MPSEMRELIQDKPKAVVPQPEIAFEEECQNPEIVLLNEHQWKMVDQPENVLIAAPRKPTKLEPQKRDDASMHWEYQE